MIENDNKQQHTDEEWRDLLDGIPGAVYALQPGLSDEFPIYMNRGCLDMLEVESLEEARACCNDSFWNYVDPEDKKLVQDVYRRLSEKIGTTEAFDCGIITGKGNRHLMHVIARAMKDLNGNTVIIDFTMDLGLREPKKQSGDVDQMTGLLSMHAFFRAVETLRKETSEEDPLAILFINIVNFKILNFHYGVSYGDRFLGAVTQNIRHCFPGCIAAHISGDHFAVLAGTKELANRAEQLRNDIRGMAPDSVDCSIGACIWKDPEDSPETIGSRAKIACDNNADHSNTFFSYYTEEIGEKFNTSSYVTASINEAIDKDWIQVYYQPIIRAISGQLCGMEALARWNDPTRGFLSPAVFIGPLEEAQLIWKLDLCVASKVVETIAGRMQSGEPVIPVSINLSRTDFVCCDIFAEIENLVRKNDIPRRLLHIEVTESILAFKENGIPETIDRFRDAGYEIWMDDFGSGYSTLNQLKDYRFDVLKMDMNFLRDDTSRSRAIIASVIAMDKKIGNRTLAEGVETKEQADFMIMCGCEKLQGFYFGKPMPFDEVLAYCEKRGYTIENARQKLYSDAVGNVDFLTDAPMVVAEEEGGKVRLLAMNQAAQDRFQADGIDGLQEAERYTDSWNNEKRERFATASRYAVSTGKEGELLESFGGRERLLHYRFLSELDGRRLFSVRIYNYFGILEKLTRKNQSLMGILGFYRNVFSIDIKALTIRSLRYADDLEGSGGELPLLQKGGAPSEILPGVFPADQKRYREFLDPETLAERLSKAGNSVIGGAFRTEAEKGKYRWMSHRIGLAQVDGREEVMYLIRAMDEDIIKDEAAIRRSDPYRALDLQTNDDKQVLWDDLMMDSPIPLFWKDKDRRFLGASRSFLDYYGFDSVDEILGKTDEEMNWHPNNEAYHDDEMEVINSGELHVFVPGRCIAGGTARRIYATKWPTYRDGEIMGLMGFFLDDKFMESRLSSHTEGADQDGGLQSPAAFLNCLVEYQEDYQLNGRPFGLLLFQITEFTRILGSYGRGTLNRVASACAEVVAKEAGIRSCAAELGAGLFAVAGAFTSRQELQETGERIRRGIEKIHRVDDITVTLFVQVWDLYGEKAMQVQRAFLSALAENEDENKNQIVTDECIRDGEGDTGQD